MSHHRKHNPLLSRPWLIRIPAMLALAISVFLIYQKGSGKISSIAGCGGEDGCAQVLGGRWSEWFGTPVTVLAAAVYIGALLLTLPAIAESNSRLARKGLLAVAMLVLLSAGWFIGLLVFVEKAFCPYCLATHVCGIVFGVLVLKTLAKPQERIVDRRKGKHATRPSRGFGLPAAVAAAGIATLILGQLFGPRPQTHEIVNVSSGGTPSSENGQPEAAVAKTVTEASFVDDRIRFTVGETPHIGNPAAKHVLAEFFDYTCTSCRQMHGDMHRLKEKHPDQFLILLLPCPLNILCNPYFNGDSIPHTNACEYARLSLAIWHAAPEKFADFHDYLMEGVAPPSLTLARAKADELAGSEAMAAAAKDPRIEQRLKQTFEQYRILAASSPKMPKVMLGGNWVLNGLAKDADTFVQLMGQHFKLP